MGLNYQFIFRGIVIFTIGQRIYELFLSNKNIKNLFIKGGILIKEKNYLLMVILHTSWLAVLLYYSMFVNLVISQEFFIVFFFLFLLGQMLRIIAIKTLGERWSTQIIILPGAPAINKGVFKYFRHPNYLGVIIELASLPLMVSLYKVSLVFSLLNFFILYFRIKLEELSLSKYNDYKEIFNIAKENKNV
jgi:methyltransferase